MGLLGSSRAEALPAITAQISRLERPEHAPLRARPGPTVASWCTREPPPYPAAESTREITRDRRRKLFFFPGKGPFGTYIQGSPSGCGWLEFPGVS